MQLLKFKFENVLAKVSFVVGVIVTNLKTISFGERTAFVQHVGFVCKAPIWRIQPYTWSSIHKYCHTFNLIWNGYHWLKWPWPRMNFIWSTHRPNTNATIYLRMYVNAKEPFQCLCKFHFESVVLVVCAPNQTKKQKTYLF